MDDASRGRAAGKGDGPADIAAGEGAPRLDLDGFSGPLDLLLALARAQRIDLKRIPLPAPLDQLVPALRQAVPLAERGGWLVTAAWLVLLRSRLLLPGQAPAGSGTGQGKAGQGAAPGPPPATAPARAGAGPGPRCLAGPEAATRARRLRARDAR